MGLVAVSIGHNEKAQGAEFEGHTEYMEARTWVPLIVEYLEAMGINAVQVPATGLKEKVQFINDQRATAALEIHFNAGSFTAHGTETLYYPNSIQGKAFASLVQKLIVGAIHTRDRGVKEGWYKMKVGGTPDYFLEATNCPSIIIEPEFLYLHKELQDVKEHACRAIALGVAGFLV